MNVSIIKYNAGNICSVDYALRRLGIEATVTSDHETLLKSDKIIFPGVGEAHTTRHYLQQTGLDLLIPRLKQPVLGICLGMQLMCKHSEEGNTPGLHIFDADVIRFRPNTTACKVPHMGWNTIRHSENKLFADIPNDAYVYFVHSFYVPLTPYTIAQTDYILPFSAVLQKDNFYATQFHPEKSGEIGTTILKNFLNL